MESRGRRRWQDKVLTLSISLRYRLAINHELTSKVLGIFIRVVFGWLRAGSRWRLRVGRSWDDAIAERSGRCEDAVVGDEVDPWSRHERGESCQEVERVENYVGRAVAEFSFKLIDDPGAVGGQ